MCRMGPLSGYSGRVVLLLLCGILAPPLILIVILLTGDRRVMGHAVNSRLLSFLGWLTLVVMVVAAFGLFFAA